MSASSGIIRLEARTESEEPASLGALSVSASGTVEEEEQQQQLGMNSSGSSASIARFPKLDDCAHFHYEHVELGRLEVSLTEQSSSDFTIRVKSSDAFWTLQRSLDNLVLFDRQLHRCIFDRSYSRLTDLSSLAAETSELATIVSDYLRRFSSLSHEGLNCGPVLNWLQIDNRGRRILVPEADSCPINMPAVAAAYAVRPHQAQAPDEISFEIADMISVIDMPPAGESSWWRGKRGFDVGFFPAECVALIGDKVPRHLASPPVSATSTNGSQLHHHHHHHQQQPVKPVLRKHGKLIAFFRSFILNRPSRRRLKQSGILRERVFGCDLGEHLLNSGRSVPSVLTCCANFIERHGLVDGIYRLSGVTSNIQRLRHAFDEDRLPILTADDSILHDIHSVASLLKMYFRELPNPLCTYQLYTTFVSAVQTSSDAEKLSRMRDAVRKLPPPHYRTLEYLMRHLVRVAARGEETGMTPRNVAIVWAPNLLRCKELEVGGVAALQGVGVQAVVTEFLICYAELIFAAGPCDDVSLAPSEQRPKSLAIANTSTRLLTLEEARNRSLAPEPELIDVGPGAQGLPLRYHTIIDLPPGQRKRSGSKRSPSLNWRALFTRASAPARQSIKKESKRAEVASSQVQCKSVSAPMPMATIGRTPISYPGSSSAGANVSLPVERRPLRPVKSADSLDGTMEDGLGPLLAAGPSANSSRTCGHSRSVSHDSYFEQLIDAASPAVSTAASASALDLSDIHLSFELEEREMRMLSGEESLEVSPRRQRSKQPAAVSSTIERADVASNSSNNSSNDDGTGSSVAGLSGPSTLMTVGGSKRKRSRLEERLQCDVELRFIDDSQSPDQIMVSADVHDTETPSPLPTPGYLPLLSEASTPLTPNVSPAAVSPRISFKSFALPLEVDEIPALSPLLSISPAKDEKVGLLRSYSTQSSRDRDSRLSFGSCLKIIENDQNNAMEACESDFDSRAVSTAQEEQQRSPFVSSTSDFFDQEMTLCDRLNEPSSIEMATQSSPDDSLTFSNTQNKNKGGQETVETNKILDDKSANQDDTPNSPDITEQDAPMICEQSYESVAHLNLVSDVMITDNKKEYYDSIEDTQKFNDNFKEAKKWLTSNASTVAALMSSQENVDNHQDDESLKNAKEICTTNNTASKDENSQKTTSFYRSLDIAQVEKNSQNNNTNLFSSCENGNLGCNSGLVNNISRPKLTDIETNMLRTSSRLDANQSKANFEMARRSFQVTENTVKNPVYRIDKSKVPWRSVRTDDGPRDTSENIKKASNASSDEASVSFNKKVDEFRLVNEQCESVIDTQAFTESKESAGNIFSEKSTEQVTNNHSEAPANSNEKYQKYTEQKCSDSNSCTRDDLAVVVPLESAAVEPQEMAHVPDVISDDTVQLRAKVLSSNIKRIERNSGIQKNTATILQELALQRFSSERIDSSPLRRRLNSDYMRDRRSFDSEIGREIVREHKMKAELENARGKMDELLKSNCSPTTQASHQLPPCLRARQARSTRAALSRSLDEAKFNKMTGNSMVSESSASSEKLCTRSGYVTKNLGGIDLDDPQCRERIEKYKEERRTFLRDKYRSESFRGSASSTTAIDKQQGLSTMASNEDQVLLARLKQRASKPSLL